MMDNNETVNLLADFILLSSLPAVLYFTIRYGVRWRLWSQSLIGIMFFSLGLALSVFDGIVLASLFLGSEYPGRPGIRLVGYVLLTLALYFICLVYEVERRSPNSVLPRELPGELRKIVGGFFRKVFRRR